MADRAPRRELRVHLVGVVVIPTWLAVVLGAMTLCGSLCLIIVLMLYSADIRRLEREIRVLQVHSSAIEVVLEEKAIAKPGDFPTWEGVSTKRGPDARPEPDQDHH